MDGKLDGSRRWPTADHMSKPILVGYDPSRGDYAPVELGAELARLTGAPLVVASVEGGAPLLAVSTPQNDVDFAVGQVDPDLLPDCGPALEQVDVKLSALGIRYECRKLRSTSAARALQTEAEVDDAALLVVGSSRRAGPGRVIAGSTAERLLHGSPCAVGVAPVDWKAEDWRGHGKPGEIGVGYADTDEGRQALHSAHALARRLGAPLRVVTVVREGLRARLESEPRLESGRFGKDVEDVDGEYRLVRERRLEATVADLGEDVPVEAEVLIGDPAEALVDLSDGLDLLVCGSRGYGPLRGVLLGSVTRRVIAEAHCPMIVLPRGVGAPLEALLEDVLQADRR
jgi:nucleotide-binding universal stress UspA family protein